MLHISVTPASLERALKLCRVLIDLFEARGASIRVDAAGAQTVLERDGFQLPFQIQERVNWKEHVPTPKEKRARDQYYDSWRTGKRVEPPNIPQVDIEPTGRLTVNRPHQGRWCFGKTPLQTFLDSKNIAKEKTLMAA